jgi:pimeloyl-ACP methyl ester carboxylesterase
VVEAPSTTEILELLAASVGDADSEHLLAGLRVPLLLIVGGHDPVTSPGQREAFRSAPRGQMLEVTAAGHFVHADDPLQYASAVSDFVRVAAGDLSGTGTGQVPATGS